MKLTTNEIENGIYELIRLWLVANGYLPDVTAYLPGNVSGWETAKTAIITGGKKLVYVENAGSYQGRENLEENCIVIDLEDQSPSMTGTKSVPEYKLNEPNNNYDKSITAEGLFDLQYRVSLVCYDIAYLSIMETCLFDVLRMRKTVSAIDNGASITGKFWLWRRNYINLDSQKFLERAILFDVPSIDLIGDVSAGVVARAEEITVGVVADNSQVAPGDEEDISVVID